MVTSPWDVLRDAKRVVVKVGSSSLTVRPDVAPARNDGDAVASNPAGSERVARPGPQVDAQRSGRLTPSTIDPESVLAGVSAGIDVSRVRRVGRCAGAGGPSRRPTRARVLRGHRHRARPAGAAPAPARPRLRPGGCLGRPGHPDGALPRRLRSPRPDRRAGAAHRRRPGPARPLPQRPAHARAAAGAGRGADRQRERHRGHRRRSASATTTGSQPWWPIWSARMCWSCSPMSMACTTGRPSAAAAQRIAQVAGPADLAGVVVGGTGAAGVGLGGMTTKVEAARIATEAGIPAVLTSASNASPRPGRRAGGHVLPCHRRIGPRRGCCGWRTPPRAWARSTWTRARSGPASSAARSLLPAGITARRGWFRRTGPGRPARARRASWSAAAWWPTTPRELPALLGRSTRELAVALGPEYEREVVHRDDLVLLT